MTSTLLLDQTTRIAIAAYLHDLGKLAERAHIAAPNLDELKTLHCPTVGSKLNADGSTNTQFAADKHTHVHAAYTSLAFDELEKHMPDFAGSDCSPFTGRGSATDRQAGTAPKTDSLVNAAANHHKPTTFLQWVITQADRLASGLDRESFEKYNGTDDVQIRDGDRVRGKENIRQATLFEQLNQDNTSWKNLTLRYPLDTLSPKNIFPQASESLEESDKIKGTKQYADLWGQLLQGISEIPKSHRSNPTLWLDHFDSLWLHICQAVPSTTQSGHVPDVSLYDHSRTTAALAAGIWRYHTETNEKDIDINQKKLLLIQGDFFGIQNFVFADGANSNKKANKLLRGRSFMVNLLTECAALKVLEALELPPTSLVLNAAGKFLIVAHNTPNAQTAIKECRTELNQWFLKHTFGEQGIGIATTAASTADFCLKDNADKSARPFEQLIAGMYEALDQQKHQRFNLTNSAVDKQFKVLDQYAHGECQVQGRIPAYGLDGKTEGLSLLAQDQIKMGEQLVKKSRIAIVRHPNDMHGQKTCLALDYFGYHIAFVEDKEARGNFGDLIKNSRLVRLLDFDTASEKGNTWNGFARRFVNTYAPVLTQVEVDDDAQRYTSVRDENGAIFAKADELKTLQHLALDNKTQTEQGAWQGITAIAALKGDIDNLGTLFQTGLQGKLTFSRWASLSRQVHFFYSLWLPWACEHGWKSNPELECLKNTYTVFAGGDDFFLLGPWHSQIKASSVIKKYFDHYVGNTATGQQKITFSAGIIIVKPDLPIRAIAEQVDKALEHAKANTAHTPKNALHLWHTIPYKDVDLLTRSIAEELQALLPNASTGIIYDLMQLADMAQRMGKPREKPDNALWRSKLAYRLTRYCEQNSLSSHYASISAILTQHIQTHKGAFAVPLSLITYQQRT